MSLHNKPLYSSGAATAVTAATFRGFDNMTGVGYTVIASSGAGSAEMSDEEGNSGPSNPNLVNGEGGSADEKTKPKRVIELKVYFRYVKSKFTKIEQVTISRAMRRYQALAINAKHLGQQALYEEVTQLLVTAGREQQIFACGYEKVITRADIDRFRGLCKDKVVLEPIANFPRAIPKTPAAKLAHAQERKLFDEYVVLFHPAGDKVLTTEEKIKKKDPILFGVLRSSPDRLYVVTDWVDEFCDLTVEKLISSLQEGDKDYANYLPEKLTLPTPRQIAELSEEVNARLDRLAKTNSSNWRGMADTERDSKTPRRGFWGKVAKLMGW